MKFHAVFDELYTEESRWSEMPILGTNWNAETYEVNIKPVKSEEVELTKCNIFWLISFIFNPPGLISSLLIKGKMLIQRAGSEKLSWDSSLPVEIKKKLNELRQELLNNVCLDISS